MAKKLATLTKQEYEKLCNLDYCDIYSAHKGVLFPEICQTLEIFVAVNRYGRLFINVNFYPDGHKTFNFDDLSGAIKWARNRVEVIDESN